MVSFQDNVDNVNKALEPINVLLQQKCPNLKIQVIKFGVDCKLELIREDNIVLSFLHITTDDDTYNILSHTEEKYRNRKYNKLLTAVSIYIADVFLKDTGVNTLFSSTSVLARKKILEKYNHVRTSSEHDSEEFRLPMDIDNKNIADMIIKQILLSDFNCSTSGGKRTRRKRHVNHKRIIRKTNKQK